MGLSTSQAHGLDVALNEANLLGLKIQERSVTATVWVAVLSLPETEPEPPDRVRALELTGLTRVVASLRNGRWDDETAEAVPLAMSDLSGALREFGGLPMYGWEFIDPPETSWAHWKDRLSLDVTLSADTAPHVLEMFQERAIDTPCILDLRLWFTDVRIRDRDHVQIGLDEFIKGGERWWQAMHAADPRTMGHGIVALRPKSRLRRLLRRLLRPREG